MNVYEEEKYFTHFLERVDWKRDLHFYTKTTIDTLDYSGDDINEGSKLVVAAAGKVKRNLIQELRDLTLPYGFTNIEFVSRGNLVIEGKGEINKIIAFLESQDLEGVGLITIVDNISFVCDDFSNWLWVTFTRSNPANDIYGLHSENINKHFSCSLPIIDARIKEHHAPILER